ncbi:putative lysine--tRNA ligase, cytoplasmic [Astathelohania contejeani]|uniref:Lysine--tRNA ligase n=1 Tax=Astathelohania contejeani TaxID=164912 RepID=A0ABQ7HXU9_9MICR|nr:putative lysine--tRNA ligase, cytoplasmic [Thelohania contejeani]
MTNQKQGEKSIDKGVESDEYYIQRLQKISTDISNGIIRYPHKFEVKHDISYILEHYSHIKASEKVDDVVQSTGRIMSIRDLGRFVFCKLMSNDKYIQLVIINQSKEMDEIVKTVRRGDIVGYSGNPGKTKTGEMSVFIKEMEVLTPCLRTIPMEHFGIKDSEIIYRRRYLDLLMNSESKKRFIIRANVIKYIRKFLDTRGFLEVETPMMNMIPGGAAAKPFKTYHNELKLDLFMRISPELFLKMLVVGGMDRVYEMGKVYRNEGIDLTHNPEFTICEFYMAYADFEDLMKMTEEMLCGMVKEIAGTTEILYHPPKREERPDPVTIDFKGPFKRINLLDGLSEKLGIKLTGENIENKEILEKLIGICDERGIIVSEPKTISRVLDKLVGEFLEPECTNPTFITCHPQVMSPLAKKHRSLPGLTERFELFINGKEICNAYTELNDPIDQRNRFIQQASDKAAGDDEAMPMDEGFCVALEYGLPPTAGWGIGIDRLVMFLTNAANIRDVVLFPAMKPE